MGTPKPRKDAPKGKRYVAEAPRRRKSKPTPDVEREVLRLAGRRGPYLLGQLMEAAEAFANDRDRDAVRILRPVRDALPDSATVRELTGLAQYRVGNYRAASKELEAFVEITDAADQHPVLMDCYRAQKRWKRVDELWDELGVSSPSAEIVTEGRIVLAGSLADRGRLDDALEILRRKSKSVARPREHHLRMWFALADLEERAGNVSTARDLFDRVRRADPDFTDVAVRVAALR
ncbi:MAG: tetratricopeptide repeat protein [Actinomycetes bacterium]